MGSGDDDAVAILSQRREHGGLDSLQVGFANLAVVSEEAVQFGFDVGDLGIDGRVEAVILDEIAELGGKGLEFACEIVAIGCADITPAGGPGMVGNAESDTAKLATRTRLGCAGGITRVWVAVNIEHVTGANIISPARLVDQSRRIKRFDFRDIGGGVGLSLGFVKNVPHDDGGVIPMVGDHAD